MNNIKPSRSVLIEEVKSFAETFEKFDREEYDPVVSSRESSLLEIHRVCKTSVNMICTWAEDIARQGFSRNRLYRAIEKLRGDTWNNEYDKYQNLLLSVQVFTRGRKIW